MSSPTLDVGRLASLPKRDQARVLMRANPGVWATIVRGFQNQPFHWEWYDQMMASSRLCVVAPRDHAKTEVFTVNQTAWRSLFRPGTWTYVFANTGDQAKDLKKRIDAAVEDSNPSMLLGARVNTTKDVIYANGSRLTVAGSGSAVRGAHPDIIIGDDVLEESLCLTDFQRKKTRTWWSGTVSNMAHPGTVRTLPNGRKQPMEATRIYLVGTPFHRDDLLLSMRSNPLYQFRRYAGEYNEAQRVGGSWAIEVA